MRTQRLTSWFLFYYFFLFSSVCLCLVAQSCSTLCDPMDYWITLGKSLLSASNIKGWFVSSLKTTLDLFVYVSTSITFCLIFMLSYLFYWGLIQLPCLTQGRLGVTPALLLWILPPVSWISRGRSWVHTTPAPGTEGKSQFPRGWSLRCHTVRERNEVHLTPWIVLVNGEKNGSL